MKVLRYKPGLRLASVAAVMLAVALATGCASTRSEPQGPVNQDLRVVLSDQPQTLNPVLGARSASLVWSAIVEPFVHTADDLQPDKEGLAVDWTRVDANTWEFKVRPNVTFHNGEAADAEAVVYSIKMNRDNPKAILKSYFANITEVTAVDATTVRVVTKTPNISIPAMFTTLYVLPPAYYEQVGDEGFDQAPVGTGPFRFDSRVPGQNVKAVAYDGYWKGKPALSSITWTWSNDAASRAALLQSNGADLVADIPVENQGGLRETEGVTLTDYPTVTKMTLFIQTGRAPMDDLNLRRAVAMGIDRDLLASGIFRGVGARPNAGLLNISPSEQPVSPVAYDQEAARALVTGSPTIDLTYPAGHNPHVEDVAEAIAGMLAEIGITVNLLPVDYPTLVKQAAAGSMNGMFLLGAVPVFPHPDVYVHGFVTSNSITHNCVDPALDELAEEGLAAADDAEAKQIYDEIERTVIAEKACYVPLYDQVVTWGSRGVTGFKLLPVTLVDYYPLAKS